MGVLDVHVLLFHFIPNPLDLLVKLGIVGHAQEKFTFGTELKARQEIEKAIKHHNPEVVISGRSPMGGVDIYAEEIAAKLGVPTKIYQPEIHKWDGSYAGKIGFKQRNLQIAEHSDVVLVVVLKTLHPSYKGMKFNGCYHCGTRNPEHVKSGGCWTAWKCRKQEWIIIP